MTRKLFALLALLSGLAALSAPANASFSTPASSVDASQSASNDCGAETREYRAKRLAKSKARSNDTRSQRNAVSAPRSLRAPLVMGVERAHE